jgi:hypothetical protein
MDAIASGRSGGTCSVMVGDFELRAGSGDLDATGAVKLVVRPERVILDEHGATGANRVPGMVERAVYVGPVTQLIVRLAPGDQIQVMVANRGDERDWRQGTPVSAFLPPDAIRVVPSDEGGTPAADAMDDMAPEAAVVSESG